MDHQNSSYGCPKISILKLITTHTTRSPLATPTILIDHAPNHAHLSLELVSLPLLLTGATKLDLVGHLLDEHLLLLAFLVLDTKCLVLCVCVCVWCGRVCVCVCVCVCGVVCACV